MKRLFGFIGLLIIVAALWLVVNKQLEILSEEDTEDAKTVTIANWNLKIFGVTKAAKEELMQDYAATLANFDIIFVQEIRDKNGTAFQNLCQRLPDYTCNISSRAGRSSSKEQYGVLYRNISNATGKKISLIRWRDYNPDEEDRWERPPLAVTFNVDDYMFIVYNIHTKPDDTPQELAALQNLIPNTGNIVLLGDLNADCGYYNHEYEQSFENWHWIIEDTEDTTVSRASCAYDRILLNDDAFEEYGKKGIVTESISPEHSDHYLVWLGLKPEET